MAETNCCIAAAIICLSPSIFKRHRQACGIAFGNTPDLVVEGDV
jgi:hypothetical protein